jgi:hypothetical protein
MITMLGDNQFGVRDFCGPSNAEYDEDELAYLYNDIGPLLYVFNSVRKEGQEKDSN